MLATSHEFSPRKVAFWKGDPLISGKSRLVKYYSIWPDRMVVESSINALLLGKMRRKDFRSFITVKGWWHNFFLLPPFGSFDIRIFSPEPRPHRLKRPFETLETAFQVTCQVRFQAFGWLVVLRARGGYSERIGAIWSLVYLNSRNVIRLLLWLYCKIPMFFWFGLIVKSPCFFFSALRRIFFHPGTFARLCVFFFAG